MSIPVGNFQSTSSRSQVSEGLLTASAPNSPESNHCHLGALNFNSSKVTDNIETSRVSQPKKSTFRISKICITIDSSREAIVASASELWSVLEVVIPVYRPSMIDENYLFEFLNECIDTCSQETWVQDANDWSKDFVDSDDLPGKFLKDFDRHGRQFIPLIKEIQMRNDPFEFNRESCDRVFGDCSEISPVLFSTVQNIASNGSRIFLPDNFVPNHVPLPRRSLDISLGKANLKQAYKLCSKGKAAIFRLSDMSQRDLEQLSFHSQLHNVAKANDRASRMCFDASNPPDGMIPLNHPSARAKSILSYPSETLPTLESLVRSWLKLVDDSGQELDEFFACIRDYKGAFATTKLEPESACLTAVKVSDEIIMIQMYGCFGLQDQSHVWSKVIEATDIRIRTSTHGVISTYVDDVCQFSHADHIHDDDKAGFDIAVNLHNKSPFDDDKEDLFTQNPVVIGWCFNFQKGVFRPNNKGIKKLFLTFFCLADITTGAIWSIKLIQIFAIFN